MAKAKICVAGRKSHLCLRCRGDILPGQKYRLKGKKRFHYNPDCDHAEPITAWRPLPIPDDPYWKLFRPLVWRFVRSLKRRVAQVSYECWDCYNSHNVHRQMLSEIFAGDEYDTDIYVSQSGWEIRRKHTTCPWDPFEDDWDSEHDEEEDEESQAA